MSWHCSLELVEEFSQAKVWVTGSCARWKKIRIAERSLCEDKKIKALPSSPSGTMSTPSTGTPGMALSMSFLLGFHAKDSPLQESKREQTIPETSGQPQQGSSEKYVQAELFSKTYQESESTSESWPETLPIWGMTLNGALFPLEKPELHTLEKDGGAWPTPQARDWKNGHGPRYINKERSNDLNDAVDYNENYNPIWPTPRAANPGSRVNGKGGKILNEEVLIKEGLKERGEYANKPEWPTPTSSEKSGINPKTGRGGGLSRAVKDDVAWPTPRSSDSQGGVVKNIMLSEDGSFSRQNEDGVRWGVNLRDAAPAYEKKWPTPTASDHKGKNSSIRKSTGKLRTDRLDHVNEVTGKPALRLNPDWVEWLMGWPIGWTSLDFINFDMKRWWRYCMSVEPARYWEEDPADIPVGMKYHTPRLTTKKEYRAQRLKCCGNGQVPQQLLLAMRVLCQERQTHGLQ